MAKTKSSCYACDTFCGNAYCPFYEVNNEDTGNDTKSGDLLCDRILHDDDLSITEETD